jgi:hypothetical protein
VTGSAAAIRLQSGGMVAYARQRRGFGVEMEGWFEAVCSGFGNRSLVLVL